MPTIDDVIGNLGEPLDFVEYRVDDEGGTQDKSAESNAQKEDIAGLYNLAGGANIEAAGPSGSGSCPQPRTSAILSA